MLTQLNSININVYWVLIAFPTRPNYNPIIISTNHSTLKYPKPLKITKIPPKLKKWPKYPLNLKMTKIPLKIKNKKKKTKIPPKPKKEQNTLETLKMTEIFPKPKN